MARKKGTEYARTAWAALPASIGAANSRAKDKLVVFFEKSFSMVLSLVVISSIVVGLVAIVARLFGAQWFPNSYDLIPTWLLIFVMVLPLCAGAGSGWLQFRLLFGEGVNISVWMRKVSQRSKVVGFLIKAFAWLVFRCLGVASTCSLAIMLGLFFSLFMNFAIALLAGTVFVIYVGVVMRLGRDLFLRKTNPFAALLAFDYLESEQVEIAHR